MHTGEKAVPTLCSCACVRARVSINGKSDDSRGGEAESASGHCEEEWTNVIYRAPMLCKSFSTIGTGDFIVHERGNKKKGSGEIGGRAKKVGPCRSTYRSRSPKLNDRAAEFCLL